MTDQARLEAFLRRPLVAHVATAALTVRPVWFLWEEGAFWWVTGTWSSLPRLLLRGERMAIVVDSCDITTGEVLQVAAWGKACLAPFDPARIYRKLCRYLGPSPSDWDERFQGAMEPNGASSLARLTAERIVFRDLSFRPSLGA